VGSVGYAAQGESCGRDGGLPPRSRRHLEVVGWIEGIFKLLGALASWLESRQLIDAGKAEEKAKTDDRVLKEVAEANDARTHANDGGLRDDDGFKRK
jgi:hypothetical protein